MSDTSKVSDIYLMKQQYFGDINDYRKYGILRALSAGGLKTTVCWMLTENDSRNDGGCISYLQRREDFRSCDPDLFDALHHTVAKKNKRTVYQIQKQRLISHARYLHGFVPDNLDHRLNYFKHLLRIAQGSEIIFFDPDNGIEIKSKPKGKKDSNKYLYWDEIKRFWKLGYSMLIYQHFPRVNRLGYIRKVSKALCKNILPDEIIIP